MIRSHRSVRILVGIAVTAAVVVGMTAADRGLTNAALSGFGAGAIVGAIALGVVLCYRSGGVVNFSLGAQVMYAAYVYDSLKRSGSIFLPPLPNPLVIGEWVAGWFGVDLDLPDIPTSIDLGTGPLTVASALIITLVLAGLFGFVLDLVVFRRLRSAPPLASIAASVGLLLLMQGIIQARFTTAVRSVAPLFQKQVVELPFGLFVQADQVIVFGLLALAAIALTLVTRYTRFGVLTRAASENPVGYALQAHSANGIIGANWVLSSVVASLFGIIVVTVNGGVDPLTVTLLIVPALAAALIGGFTSYGKTIVAALVIAMIEALFVRVSNYSWFPRPGGTPLPGIASLVPLLIIAGFLFRNGEKLPGRGSAVSEKLPHAPVPTRRPTATAVAVAVVLAATFLFNSPWRIGLGNTLVGVAVCLALVVIVGYTGQLSLMIMSLAGVAGFALARLSSTFGVPFPIGPIIAVILAGAVGTVVALPALRVRGTNLAILTLSAAITFEVFVFSNSRWTGGVGSVPVEPPSLFGWNFGPNVQSGLVSGLPNPWFGVFLLVVVVGLALVVGNIRTSTLGRRMIAVRTNERAAAAIGISASRTKILATTVSALVAGVAGVLAAYNLTAVTPDYFGAFASLSFLAFAYLGGISSISGAVVAGTFAPGALGATAMHEWFHVPADFLLLVAGVGLIVNAVLNPEGISKEIRAALPFGKHRGRTSMPAEPVDSNDGQGPASMQPAPSHVAVTK